MKTYHPLVRTKKFFVDHKVGIAITATALVALQLNKLALKDHENFMEENGILESYYNHGGEI
jgi:hypothetical protein